MIRKILMELTHRWEASALLTPGWVAPGENAETVSLLITLGFLMRIKWKRLAKP
jgi:hypothetical protein